MCELNARITAWRDTLAARLSGAEVAELEDHLREALGGLPEDALSPDERFLIATRRLGAPGAIVEEFEKADPARVWQSRVFWMLAGWLGAGLVGGLAYTLAQGLSLGVWRLGASPQVAGLAELGLRATVWLLVAWQFSMLLRGDDRRASRLIGWVNGLSSSLRMLLVVAVALVVLGIPTMLMQVITFKAMTLSEFTSRNYVSAVGNMALGTGVNMGLLIATLSLAACRRRRAAPAAGPGGTR
jgi:hypothetical protein